MQVKHKIAIQNTCITFLINQNDNLKPWNSLLKAFSQPIYLASCQLPTDENTRSVYALDAAVHSRSWASGANNGYLLAFMTQNISPLFSEYFL